MNLQSDVLLAEDEVDVRDVVRRYLNDEIRPLVEDHERARTFPWERLPPLTDLGFVRAGIPQRDGGDGATVMIDALLMEEAGRCWGSLRTAVNILSLVAHVLSRWGNEDQKRRYLDPLLRGERRAWFAMTEPEAGSDAASLRTTARRHGDGFIVDGRKLYITNALGADFGILLARIVEDGADRGISALILDAEDSRFEIHDVPHLPVRSATSCEMVFSGTAVPGGSLVGEPGRGLAVAMGAINRGRLNMAMGAVGLAQACLESATDFATAREQFGRPIGSFQLVQEMVAEIATLTQSSRLIGYLAARTLDAGASGRLECSMAKFHCAEAANRAATLALQLHGGAGLMEGTPVERYFRDARETTIPEGTSQIQLLQMGRELLGLSAMS